MDEWEDLGDGYYYDPSDGSVYDSSTDTWTYEDDSGSEWSDADFQSMGYEDQGDGYWYDPSDGGTWDPEIQEWTYDDGADAADEDYSDLGYEDLGDGYWYDPSDGSVYDTATGEWTYDDQTAAGGFTDPFGNTFYDDGRIEFPDGTIWNPADGSYELSTGGSLNAEGDSVTFTDEAGGTWENMAYAGAPNLWQNTATGDVWDNSDGHVTYSVEDGTMVTDPTPTAVPPARTAGTGGAGGNSPFGGSNSSGNKPGEQQKPKDEKGTSLNDLTKLLQGVTNSAVAVKQAKQALAGAKTPAARNAAKSQLSSAQQSYQSALAAKNHGGGGLGQAAIWIAGGAAALLLLTMLTRQPIRQAA